MDFVAILVAAVVYFIIGFLVHGPLFGKLWMRLANVHQTGEEKMSDMYGQMLSNYVANVVSAGVLSTLILAGGTWQSGMGVALLVWLAISAHSVMDVIWMRRSVKLWLFSVAYTLVGLSAMGALLVIW